MEKSKNRVLLTHDIPTSGIFAQVRESEYRDWNSVTAEDLESIGSIVERKSRRPGFGLSSDEKKIILDVAKDIGFPKASRGSNYTKPKKRKKR